jgi:ABC-type dipeptide/oligopeptide/nickel transport system permease subunit
VGDCFQGYSYILISLYISVLKTIIAFLPRVPIDLEAGFYRASGIDETITRVIDALLSFQTFVSVHFISDTYGQKPLIASIAIGKIGSPIVVRLVRGWKAVSAFIIICSTHVHWFVLQPKLISIQSIIVLTMR